MFTIQIEKAIMNITKLSLLQESESETAVQLGLVRLDLVRMQQMPETASESYAVQAYSELQAIIQKNGQFAKPFADIPIQITDVVCLACCRDIDPYDTDAYRAQIDNASGGELTELMASQICNARWQVFEHPHQ